MVDSSLQSYTKYCIIISNKTGHKINLTEVYDFKELSEMVFDVIIITLIRNIGYTRTTRE